MKIHITSSNNKIGNTANISLPPIETCINGAICRDGCYAVKFYIMYKEVRNAWNTNLKILQSNPTLYFEGIRRYLLKKTPEYFRWHVSGDIVNQDYFNQMRTIAKDYYFTKFVVFTKNYYLNFLHIPQNLSVVLSVWPGFPIPVTKLPLAFVDCEEEKRAFNFVKCLDNCEECRACWELNKMKKNVLLRKH